MSSGDSRSSTGRACLPSKASPSLSPRTRQLTNIQTASASSTFIGPPLRQGPLLSSPSPLSGSWSPCAATSGQGMTEGVGKANTSSSRQSPVGYFKGGSHQAGPSPCHLSQSRPLMSSQPCQGRGGIGRPVAVGQGPRLVPLSFPNMPCQPFLPLPEGKSRVCSSSSSQASHPSTTSQLVFPVRSTGCRTSGSVSYHARLAISCDWDRFTEIRDEPQPQQQPRQTSSQSSVAESLPFQRRERSPSRQSRGRRVSFSKSEGETDSTQVGARPGRQRPRQHQQLSGPKSSCRVFKTGVRADSE